MKIIKVLLMVVFLFILANRAEALTLSKIDFKVPLISTPAPTAVPTKIPLLKVSIFPLATKAPTVVPTTAPTSEPTAKPSEILPTPTDKTVVVT